MASVTAAKHRTEVTANKVDLNPFIPVEKHLDVLETCAGGHFSSLQTLLAEAGIVAPAPAITIHNQSKYSLPQTHEMVEAAIQGRHHSTVELLYETFPTARIHGPELAAATASGDLELFKLVFKQSHSKFDVVRREFEDQETTLIKACRGNEPHIAIFLLEHGADPNYSGAASGEFGALVGPLSNAVVANQPVLIEKLIDAGAHVMDVHVLLAVDRKRPEVVKVLVNHGNENVNLKSALKRAKKVDCDEVVHVLTRRITDGKSDGEESEKSEEDEGELHTRLHNMKQHLFKMWTH